MTSKVRNTRTGTASSRYHIVGMTSRITVQLYLSKVKKMLTIYTILIWYLQQLLEEVMHGLHSSSDSLTSLKNISAGLIRSLLFQTMMKQGRSLHRRQANTSGSLYLRSG